MREKRHRRESKRREREIERDREREGEKERNRHGLCMRSEANTTLLKFLCIPRRHFFKNLNKCFANTKRVNHEVIPESLKS